MLYVARVTNQEVRQQAEPKKSAGGIGKVRSCLNQPTDLALASTPHLDAMDRLDTLYSMYFEKTGDHVDSLRKVVANLAEDFNRLEEYAHSLAGLYERQVRCVVNGRSLARWATEIDYKSFLVAVENDRAAHFFAGSVSADCGIGIFNSFITRYSERFEEFGRRFHMADITSFKAHAYKQDRFATELLRSFSDHQAIDIPSVERAFKYIAFGQALMFARFNLGLAEVRQGLQERIAQAKPWQMLKRANANRALARLERLEMEASEFPGGRAYLDRRRSKLEQFSQMGAKLPDSANRIIGLVCQLSVLKCSNISNEATKKVVEPKIRLCLKNLEASLSELNQWLENDIGNKERLVDKDHPYLAIEQFQGETVLEFIKWLKDEKVLQLVQDVSAWNPKSGYALPKLAVLAQTTTDIQRLATSLEGYRERYQQWLARPALGLVDTYVTRMEQIIMPRSVAGKELEPEEIQAMRNWVAENVVTPIKDDLAEMASIARQATRLKDGYDCEFTNMKELVSAGKRAAEEFEKNLKSTLEAFNSVPEGISPDYLEHVRVRFCEIYEQEFTSIYVEMFTLDLD